MKPSKESRITAIAGSVLLGQVILSGLLYAQLVVHLENVYLQSHQIPQGWNLITNQRNSEVLTRIVEAQLDVELTSVWTQKFAVRDSAVEIEYLGGVSEDEAAKVYSEIARKKKADAVCHKGRFVIAIRSNNPDLIRTAFRALRPEPLDRIKILDADLTVGQKIQSEVLSNLIMRESLAKHLEIMPLAVVNQFFEGPSPRQITYVACDSLEDASKAANRCEEITGGKNLVLHQGHFIVEIVGDSTWAKRVRPMIEDDLADVAADEQARIALIKAMLSVPTPTNTPTKIQKLR